MTGWWNYLSIDSPIITMQAVIINPPLCWSMVRSKLDFKKNYWILFRHFNSHISLPFALKVHTYLKSFLFFHKFYVIILSTCRQRNFSKVRKPWWKQWDNLHTSCNSNGRARETLQNASDQQRRIELSHSILSGQPLFDCHSYRRFPSETCNGWVLERVCRWTVWRCHRCHTTCWELLDSHARWSRLFREISPSRGHTAVPRSFR